MKFISFINVLGERSNGSGQHFKTSHYLKNGCDRFYRVEIGLLGEPLGDPRCSGRRHFLGALRGFEKASPNPSKL